MGSEKGASDNLQLDNQTDSDLTHEMPPNSRTLKKKKKKCSQQFEKEQKKKRFMTERKKRKKGVENLVKKT